MMDESGALFEYLVSHKDWFEPKTPDHVNKPLGSTTQEITC